MILQAAAHSLKFASTFYVVDYIIHVVKMEEKSTFYVWQFFKRQTLRKDNIMILRYTWLFVTFLRFLVSAIIFIGIEIRFQKVDKQMMWDQGAFGKSSKRRSSRQHLWENFWESWLPRREGKRSLWRNTCIRAFHQWTFLPGIGVVPQNLSASHISAQLRNSYCRIYFEKWLISRFLQFLSSNFWCDWLPSMTWSPLAPAPFFWSIDTASVPLWTIVRLWWLLLMCPTLISSDQIFEVRSQSEIEKSWSREAKANPEKATRTCW